MAVMQDQQKQVVSPCQRTKEMVRANQESIKRLTEEIRAGMQRQHEERLVDRSFCQIYVIPHVSHTFSVASLGTLREVDSGISIPLPLCRVGRYILPLYLRV